MTKFVMPCADVSKAKLYARTIIFLVSILVAATLIEFDSGYAQQSALADSQQDRRIVQAEMALGEMRRTDGVHSEAGVKLIHRLGYLYWNAKRHDEARLLYMEELSVRKQIGLNEGRDTLAANAAMVGINNDTNRAHENIPFLVEIVAHAKETGQQGLLAFNEAQLVNLYLAASNYEAAIPYLEDRYARAITAKGKESEEAILASLSLTEIQLKARGSGVPLDSLLAQVELARNHLGEEHPLTLDALLRLARIQVELGKFEEAAAIYAPLRYSSVPGVQRGIAELSLAAGDYHTTISYYQIFVKNPGNDEGQSLLDLQSLGNSYAELGLHRHASRIFERLEKRIAQIDGPVGELLGAANQRGIALLHLRNGDKPIFVEEALIRFRDLAAEYYGEEHEVTFASTLDVFDFYEAQGQELRATEVFTNIQENIFRKPNIIDGREAIIHLSFSKYSKISGDERRAETEALKAMYFARSDFGRSGLYRRVYEHYVDLILDDPDRRPLAIYLLKRILAHQNELTSKLEYLQRGQDGESEFSSFDNISEAEREVYIASIQMAYADVSDKLAVLLAEEKRFGEASYFGRYQLYTRSPGQFARNAESISEDLSGVEKALEYQLTDIISSSVDAEDFVRAMQQMSPEGAFSAQNNLNPKPADWIAPQLDGYLAQTTLYNPVVLQVLPSEHETYLFLSFTSAPTFAAVTIPYGGEEISEKIFQIRDQMGLLDQSRTSRAGAPAEAHSISRSGEELREDLAILYDMLIEPISDLLDEYDPEVIHLELHGKVRYLPFAALYDRDNGEYLTERYTLNRHVWGPVNTGRNRIWKTGTGLGVSVASENFNELPGVEKELFDIFGDKQNGIPINGPTYLNSDFTPDILQEAMSYEARSDLIHIASHFDMNADQVDASGLLLGNGEMLTISELLIDPSFHFNYTDLVVLSACSTANARGGNGLEVEGFGKIARIKGARTVLSTLWDVADESSPEFMSRFYTQLSEDGVGPAEALRRAQVELIGTTAFSDPYYWAPYILMGDWE